MRTGHVIATLPERLRACVCFLQYTHHALRSHPQGAQRAIRMQQLPQHFLARVLLLAGCVALVNDSCMPCGAFRTALAAAVITTPIFASWPSTSIAAATVAAAMGYLYLRRVDMRLRLQPRAAEQSL